MSDINYPKVYEVTRDEESGKDIYPEVKVFGYESFTEQLIEVENPFVTDEEETTEVELDSEDKFESEE